MSEEKEEMKNCGHTKEKPHSCPYGEDIYDDFETLCTCCADCEEQCAMDI